MRRTALLLVVKKTAFYAGRDRGAAPAFQAVFDIFTLSD
jgi:hypothetical protein